MFADPPVKRIGAPPTPSADLSPPIQGLDYHRGFQADVELPSLAPNGLAYEQIIVSSLSPHDDRHSGRTR